MKVTSVHNIIGWFQDKLRIENRRTYKYPTGNDVTVIERRDINVVLYNKKGKIVESNGAGSSVNVKA
jgi:hypothetical protein